MNFVSTSLFFIPTLMVPLGLFAQGAGRSEAHLGLRATEPLPNSAVTAVATYAEPTVLKREIYPEAGEFSARHVIQVQCGSYRDQYWEEVKRLNHMPNISLDQPLGNKVYEIKWPACLFVQSGPDVTNFVATDATTTPELYHQLTGARGGEEAISDFFRIKNPGAVRPGQMLTPTHVTALTRVKTSDAQRFRAALQGALQQEGEALAVVNGPVAVDSAGQAAVQWFSTAAGGSPTPPLTARLAITAGQIQSTGNTDIYMDPKECTTTPGPYVPVDPVRVGNAYGYSLQRLTKDWNLNQYPAEIWVADNGFFGAKVGSNGVDWGSAFPKRFFYTYLKFKDGQIGPVITSGGEQIYPINYSNQLNDATIVSGHGTHLVGLVLGGPAFQNYLNLFDLDQTPGKPWLRITVLNIGKGGDFLLPDSDVQLLKQFNYARDKIVNLSLVYGDDVAQALQSQLALVLQQGAANNNLFVVAAGNGGAPDVTSVYPAAFGGIGNAGGLRGTKDVSSKYVITVAAHTQDGRLATFSNRDPSNVDIAAPGCDAPSWLDRSGKLTPVSGTSQAAAIVTFTAALLRSLGNASPYLIKTRIIISGDLLTDPPRDPQVPAASAAPKPSDIFSHAKLNAAKAMFLFDDYVRYRPDGAIADAEVLGSVEDIKGVGCDRSYGTTWQNIWSLKSDGTAMWLYGGKENGKVNAPCVANLATNATLYIAPTAILAPTYKKSPGALPQMIPIRLNQLKEFVSATPPD